jgi:exopolysaccharide biosynthesis protein
MSTSTARPLSHRTVRALLAGATAAALVALPAAAGAAPATDPGSTRHGAADLGPVPLGEPGLAETRTTEVLQPGVTLTRIVRGEPDPDHVWTVEVAIPGGTTSPDPDAPPSALKDEASAAETVAELTALGFAARAEEVVTPALADVAGGTLGWRVRVGAFGDQAGATAERARLVAAGYTGSAVFTGWDSEDVDTGPWRLQVLTIDPRRFRGELDLTVGPDVERRERTSELAAAAGATAGVNGGYFVLDPASGAPGDPAGVAVLDGELLSETVDGRPALVVRDDARRSDVVRLAWHGELRSHGETLALDGVNRVPGLIRNCGGTDDDLPTSSPRHDFTCTDPDEVVLFTPRFAATSPAGAGVEVVLDERGFVTEVRAARGGPIPAGGSTVQATGALAAELGALAVPGRRLHVRTDLVDEDGRRHVLNRSTSIVNGGPELVRDGELHVTAAADGFVRPAEPSFFYGFVHKRNPRTFAGVDADGRLVLVTADGRSTSSLGLSVLETALVAQGLGLTDALNLDGGGSTTMVVGDQVVNQPSDPTGERPVGDALLVLPDRRGR